MPNEIEDRIQRHGRALWQSMQDAVPGCSTSTAGRRSCWTGRCGTTYLKTARRDIERLQSLARARGAPITVRLVKGAYWDQEVVRIARQFGGGLPRRLRGPWCRRGYFGTVQCRRSVSDDDEIDARNRKLQSMGFDPLPYGVAPNEQVLNELIDSGLRQQILSPTSGWEDYFCRSTLDLTG